MHSSTFLQYTASNTDLTHDVIVTKSAIVHYKYFQCDVVDVHRCDVELKGLIEDGSKGVSLYWWFPLEHFPVLVKHVYLDVRVCLTMVRVCVYVHVCMHVRVYMCVYLWCVCACGCGMYTWGQAGVWNIDNRIYRTITTKWSTLHLLCDTLKGICSLAVIAKISYPMEYWDKKGKTIGVATGKPGGRHGSHTFSANLYEACLFCWIPVLLNLLVATNVHILSYNNSLCL